MPEVKKMIEVQVGINGGKLYFPVTTESLKVIDAIKEASKLEWAWIEGFPYSQPQPLVQRSLSNVEVEVKDFTVISSTGELNLIKETYADKKEAEVSSLEEALRR